MVNAPEIYKSIFKKAFPNLHFTTSFADNKSRTYVWGVYIKQVEANEEVNLRAFCELLSNNTVLIDDDLDECFALSQHWLFGRTRVGQLVYDAKSYNKSGHPGNPKKAQELANVMIQFIQQHPSYLEAELIIAVPPSNPNKTFDLPTYLVEQIAQKTGQILANSFVQKTRATRPMKECRTPQEKIANLMGVFKADDQEFQDKQVIVIDDIYQSGESINAVGREIKAVGAAQVLGLVATKTKSEVNSFLNFY